MSQSRVAPATPPVGSPLRPVGLSLLGLALLAGGVACTGKTDQRVVTGKVTYDQRPLPGGSVTFVSSDGKERATALIDSEGNYRLLNPPVGTVRIGVTGPTPSSEGGKAPSVVVPANLADPTQSGLTWTVGPEGQQEHNISIGAK